MWDESDQQSVYEKYVLDYSIVSPLAIDGLDASGKGVLTATIAEILCYEGKNVLLVDYPQYDTPWGRRIDYFLHNNVPGLTMQDRLQAFALNRAETIDPIQKTATGLYQKTAKQVFIIFDRFPTSCMITLAYSMLNPTDELKEPDWFERAVEIMQQVDAKFMRKLMLSKTEVFVPMLTPKLALDALLKDRSRKRIDLYETHDVQEKAHYLYGRLAQRGFVRLVSQLRNENDNASRKTPSELAIEILLRLGLLGETIDETTESGRLVELKVQSDQIDTRFMNEMEFYMSKRLRELKALIP